MILKHIRDFEKSKRRELEEMLSLDGLFTEINIMFWRIQRKSDKIRCI